MSVAAPPRVLVSGAGRGLGHALAASYAAAGWEVIATARDPSAARPLAAEAADYTVEKKKAATQNTGGPIIGSRLVYGEQVRGESRQAYESAVEAASQSATEAMENMQIDPELHSAIKSYFGSLDKAGNGTKGDGKPTPAAPATPAPDAKDAGKK